MKKQMIIPAVHGFNKLDKALSSPSDVIFIVGGELIQLKSIIEYVKKAGKKTFLHLEIIKGIKEDEASVHYLAKELKVQGIISTRKSTLNYAKKYGLISVQRGFLIDSRSVKTIITNTDHIKPDYIELLPALAFPKIMEVKDIMQSKIIVGGFINDREDIRNCFQFGVHAVSTSKAELWQLSAEDLLDK